MRSQKNIELIAQMIRLAPERESENPASGPGIRFGSRGWEDKSMGRW